MDLDALLDRPKVKSRFVWLLARWEIHLLREANQRLFYSPSATAKLLRGLQSPTTSRQFRIAVCLLYLEWPREDQWEPGGSHREVLQTLCLRNLLSEPLVTWLCRRLTESPLCRLLDAMITEALKGGYRTITLDYSTKTTPVVISGGPQEPRIAIQVPASLNADLQIQIRFTDDLKNPVLLPLAGQELHAQGLRPELREDASERQVIELVDDPGWYERNRLTPTLVGQLACRIQKAGGHKS